MKLKILGFENEISFEEDINVLVIENTKLFSNIVELLNSKVNGFESNEVILYNNDYEEINMQKEMHMILDLFNIEYNSKKFISKIYELISENILKDQNTEFNNIILQLRNYLIQEINEIPFEFTMSEEINIEQTLKLFNVKIDECLYSSIIERLEFIIDMIATLKTFKILIIPNLNQFLDTEEILEIYKYAMYNNIKILIIERKLDREKIKYEKIYKIDSEYDEFIL